MSDWLSDALEKSYSPDMDEGDIFEWAIEYRERLNSVIRELAEYANASHAVEKACEKWKPTNIRALRRRRNEAWQNLSPDAKELME